MATGSSAPDPLVTLLTPRDSAAAADVGPVAILTSSLCLAVAILIAFLVSVLRQPARRHKLTVLSTSLLCMCVLQCLATPAVAVTVAGARCSAAIYCPLSSSTWLACVPCGVVLHLLVVLEVVVSHSPSTLPPWLAAPWPAWATVPVVLVLWYTINYLVLVLAKATVALGTIAFFLAVGTAVGYFRAPTRVGRQAAGAAFAALACFLPFFLVMCVSEGGQVPSRLWLLYSQVCTNWRLVLDAGLCWLSTELTSPPPGNIVNRYFTSAPDPQNAVGPPTSPYTPNVNVNTAER